MRPGCLLIDVNYKNKPRVFLSHSKADAEFIERAANDFRRCQIEPWLDTEEIRHGKPWLSEIFESGIPTCDCLLVYLTENSINSAMVKREMDAGFIQKLKDQQVALLPYVSNATYREQLRLDVQSLQTPEWNTSNYNSIFPRIVAEIWRAYLERAIPATIAEERARRLEAELTLEKLRRDENAGVFSPAEEKDFAYIHGTLNHETQLTLSNRKAGQLEAVLQTANYTVNLVSLIIHLSKEEPQTVEQKDIERSLANLLKRDNADFPPKANIKIYLDSGPNIPDLLRMFGFATWIDRMESRTNNFWEGGNMKMNYYQVAARRTVFTDKVQRFRYWLATNDVDPGPAKLTPVLPFDLGQLK